jgi:hypothetical protein
MSDERPRVTAYFEEPDEELSRLERLTADRLLDELRSADGRTSDRCGGQARSDTGAKRAFSRQLWCREPRKHGGSWCRRVTIARTVAGRE